jgi:hypothetical protein
VRERKINRERERGRRERRREGGRISRKREQTFRYFLKKALIFIL